MLRKVISIVAYDPAWPDRFDEERRALRTIFPADAQIEHVGSTSVPGLAAKPVIDIMIGLNTLDVVPGAIPDMKAQGYIYVPEYERELPERRYFRKPADHPRTHHVHIVLRGSEFWIRHLLFRNRLREQPRVAKEYERLKRELAIRYRYDRPSYTSAKSEFIGSVLRQPDIDP